MQVERCSRGAGQKEEKPAPAPLDDAKRFFYRERVKGASAGDSVTAVSPADLMMAAHEIARDHFDY